MVTVNNDFCVTRGAICQRFSLVTHSWKLLANHLTLHPKIVIHGNSCIILYIIPNIRNNLFVGSLFLKGNIL